jgi:hypothetical protein
MSRVPVDYEKLPYQAEFHEAEEAYDILSAGMGAGKTYSLCMKALRLATINFGLPAGILCPDLKMFRRDVLPTFEQIADKNEFKIKFRQNSSELLIYPSKTKCMVFHAEDEGRSIRGPNLAWGIVNEVTLCSKAAFDAFSARIRIKQAKLPQIAMSGTPEGFNWFYRDFIEKQRDDVMVVYGDMRQNPHLPDSYAKRLTEQFDPVAAQAYVEGKFVNMVGKTAVQSFSRLKHNVRGTTVNRDLPIWIAVDFNVDPMSASMWQPVPIENGRIKLRGVGEIKIRDASTHTLCKALTSWLIANSPAYGFRNESLFRDVSVYPDPAGNARSTKSELSDHSIMREHGFSNLKFKKQISVRGCINALNAKLHKGEIELDIEKMPETTADLEQVVWRDGTFELDKRDQTRTHWLDGLKNMVDYEFPIGEGRGGWKEIQIR